MRECKIANYWMLSTAKLTSMTSPKAIRKRALTILIALIMSQGLTYAAGKDDALLKRSEALYKQGDDYLPKALEYVDQALKINPQNPSAHLQKAQILYDMQEDDVGALKEVNESLKITAGQTPVFTGYLFLKANILRRLKRNVEALAAFDKFTALDKDPIASNLKARIEVDLGKLKDAEKTLSASLVNHPTWVDTHAARANVRMKLKDYKGVVADTKAVEKENFKDGLAITRTALLDQAEAQYQLHNIAGMNEALTKVLKKFPDDRPSITKAMELYKATGNKVEFARCVRRKDALEKDLGL